ncbi:FAD-dependent monooxygenase [Fretibacter rubidus]|uniref:FAD-dependent monooxygenase n=1 Tax=Fretibacter rubidus TaxID=570162 RepID=UPI00352BD13F
MAEYPHILIAGAGIGGLTAATALAQKGSVVDVFEQATQLAEVGAGLQQSANAMHAHRALGIDAEVIKRGFSPHNVVLRDFKAGRPLLRVPLGDAHETRYGAPYVHIHRADLHDILRNAATKAGVTIHLGHSVTGFDQDAQKVTLHCGDKHYTGDALIGADGVRSTIAKQINPRAVEPRFTGQIAWRGIVSTATIPKDTLPPDATAWLGPGRHCVAYYLRGGELINFVAVEERDAWIDEGWSQKGDVKALRQAFAGWDPRLTTLLNACQETFLWGLFDHAASNTTSWGKGRVSLLGDACHPMLPFMAQGAAMAIEDGYVLASEIMRDGPNIDSALRRYEIMRHPRTARIQKRSLDNAAMFHHGPGAAKFLRDAKLKIAQHLPAAQHSQFDWIYGYDATEPFALK